MRKLTREQVAAIPKEQRQELFSRLADDYKEKYGCRWSEACLAIKRQYPEAGEAFGSPPEGHVARAVTEG